MPRRKPTPAKVEELITQEPEELDAFERAMLEFSDSTGVKLDILRYDRDEGRGKYLKRVDYDPNVMSFEWIRKKWGAGTYQLRFRDADNPQRGWSQVVDIAADENTERASLPPTMDTSTPLIGMLREQNQIMLAALVQNKGGGAGGDGTAIVKLIEGLNAQNQTMLAAMMNRGDTSGNILSVFEKGLELARDAKMESEGGWLAQVGRIARDLLPAIQELNRMRPIQAVPSSPGAVRAPALPSSTAPPKPAEPGFTRPSSPPAPQENTPEPAGFDRGQLLEESLRQFAPQLLEAIQQGVSADDAADGILESIPPMFYPELEAITVDRVLQYESRLKPHRGYIDQLVRRLKSVNEDEDDDQNPPDQNNSAPA